MHATGGEHQASNDSLSTKNILALLRIKAFCHIDGNQRGLPAKEVEDGHHNQSERHADGDVTAGVDHLEVAHVHSVEQAVLWPWQEYDECMHRPKITGLLKWQLSTYIQLHVYT